MTDDEDDAGEMWWDWSDAAMWIAADADPSPPPPEDR